jgi:ABC-type amino acid transport system permease subunit
MNTRLQGLLLILGLLVAWEALSRAALINPAYLPPPSSILLIWQGMAASGELAEHAGTTIRVWVQGFALAVLAGVSLGLLMGLFRPVATTLATAVELLRPMPSVAIISLGLDDPMKRFVTMYAATSPILINTLYGVLGVDPLLIDSARTFRVTGDAVCSFNPIYGQGMTVAALEAEALEACLRERSPGRHLTGLPRRFFERIARVIDVPWTLAVGEDFRYPEVTGPKPPATDLMNWYIGRVHRATLRDPVVYRAFLEAMAMLQPPAVLFHPRVVARTLWGGAVSRSPRSLDAVSHDAA